MALLLSELTSQRPLFKICDGVVIACVLYAFVVCSGHSCSVLLYTRAVCVVVCSHRVLTRK
jgi:hypothetical protein